MKRIREDFRRMLSGLNYQNAGDFLSRKEKLAFLGHKAARQSVDNVVDLNSNALKASASKKSADSV